MSGMSNVKYWLKQRGILDNDALCQALLDAAKKNDRVLTDAELRSVMERHGVAAKAHG